MKSKFILGIIFSFCIMFTGCKVGNVASNGGLTDQAYLYFVSVSKYQGPVTVTVDKAITFNADVVKEKKATVKGNTYAVATGKRNVVVTYRNKIIFERTLFLSAQETKKIILP